MVRHINAIPVFSIFCFVIKTYTSFHFLIIFTMFYKKESKSKVLFYCQNPTPLFSLLTAETLCVHKIGRYKHHRYIGRPVFLFHDAPILPIVCCRFPSVGRQDLRQEIQSDSQDNGIFNIHEITLGLWYRKHLHRPYKTIFVID